MAQLLITGDDVANTTRHTNFSNTISRLLELGVIQGRDMTTEAAMTKLMWAIGQGMSQKEIRKLFAIDLAGEVTTN